MQTLGLRPATMRKPESHTVRTITANLHNP